MAFFGSAFSFDGIPSEQFDLMMYAIENEDAGSEFASTVDVSEEVIPGRWRPLFYGVQRGKKLTFDITFGVNHRRIDARKYLDRYELQEVAAWLTGHDVYKDLEIDQEDMRDVRYKCMISALKVVTYGDIPWALQATVTCDSPYAYLREDVSSYFVDGAVLIDVNNMSSHSGYYMPVIEFELTSGDGFSVENLSDDSRTLTISGLPSSIQRVTVDNDRCIITDDQDLNIYDNCNLKWLRLKRGINTLAITGNGTFTIKCEFPVNVGG